MSEAIELLIHFVVSAIKLLKPGGVKVVMAETIAMKQQLIVMNRGKKRSPVLTTPDRFLFGILADFIGGSRLKKIAVIIKPTTILAFHKSLVNRHGYAGGIISSQIFMGSDFYYSKSTGCFLV
jgi:hypothetical protein